MIYIYGKSLRPSGIQVIIKQIEKEMNKCNVQIKAIESLDKISKDNYVVPYGVLAAFELLCKHYKCRTALLVDAISLGDLSTSLFFMRHKGCTLKFLMRQLLMFLHHLLLEIIVIVSYQKIMLVSEYDKQYFKRILLHSKQVNKIYVVPNGVDIPKKQTMITSYNPLVLGNICYWTEYTFYGIKWFFDSYYDLLIKDFHDIQFIIAGKGMTSEMKHYFARFNHIKCIGEVEHVSDFYDTINIALQTLPKKCGILNKVIEAFAYGVPVLGLKRNFLALGQFENSAFVYSDYPTLKTSLQMIRTNRALTNAYISASYDYVNNYHSWDKNYKDFSVLFSDYKD